ncbi:MAG: DUF423 domain-containing protein [Chloroflexi bacterium]|nr:DUF423 domain-containing protein [Chloroflexota bacterium]
MLTFDRKWLFLGAVLGGLSVAFGAFGVHGLRGLVTADLLANFETAARYQMYHALALVAVAFVASNARSIRTATIAGWLFVIGVVIFCGSLYAMTFTGWRWLGAITPIGGVAMIGGWASLAVAALK